MFTLPREMSRGTGPGDVERGIVRVLDVDPDLATDLDPETLRSATAELMAPVVTVAEDRSPFGPSQRGGVATGTGFLYDEDGHTSAALRRR